MTGQRNDDTYVVGNGYEWFWDRFFNGTWEPETFKIFDTFLHPNRNFLDIGSWIGPTVLYASRRANKVFAFEPDIVAFTSLQRNIQLNRADNVVAYRMAVSDQWKNIELGAKTQFGDSMSSQLWSKDSVTTPAVAFESLIIDLMPNFVKIDIEGGEQFIFDGSKLILDHCQPAIYLSLHTPWATDKEKFKQKIIEGLDIYPFFYNEKLERINLEDAFDDNAFTTVVATFIEINKL